MAASGGSCSVQAFLKDYLGTFAGRTALYLGCGPTSFRYEDAIKHTGPIIAVNYTARHCPAEKECFVFSLHYDHPEIADSVLDCNATVCVASHHLPNYRPLESERRNLLVYETGIVSDLHADCTRDAKDMARSNTLWGIHNSLSFAISFLGLTGCKSLLCVGAGGSRRSGYDARLTKSRGGKQPYYEGVLNDSCNRYGIRWAHIDTE